MKPLVKAGIVLGLGLGGFFDGIVLHQILGWHHLICTTATCQVETVEALKEQNTEDGFFHLATWILTAVGVAMLFAAAREQAQVWAGKTLLGAMLAGWGLFNFVEGLIDHQVLGIHHVRPGDPNEFLWDMLFLASGVVLMLVGGVIAKSGVGRRSSVRRDLRSLTPAPLRVGQTLYNQQLDSSSTAPKEERMA